MRFLVSCLIVSGICLAGPVCANKAAKIQTEIEYKKKHKDKHELERLERKLSYYQQKSCDDKLLLDILKTKVQKYDIEIKLEELEIQKHEFEGDIKEAKDNKKDLEKAKYKKQKTLEKIKMYESL